jgi:hypothetical protein
MAQEQAIAITKRVWHLRHACNTLVWVKFNHPFFTFWQEVTSQDVHVAVRMASMSTEENAEFDNHRSLLRWRDWEFLAKTFYLGFGQSISEDEWAENWAEGERVEEV